MWEWLDTLLFVWTDLPPVKNMASQSSPFASPRIPRRKILPKFGPIARKKSAVHPDPSIDRSTTTHLSASYIGDTRLELTNKINRRLGNLRRQHTRASKEVKRLEQVIADLEKERRQFAPTKMCVIM